MKHEWLLTDSCNATRRAKATTREIHELVNFNSARVCTKCSGGVACGVRFQVFHPTNGMSAEGVVRASR